MKVTEQCQFSAVLLVLTFDYVDEILKCGHSNEISTFLCYCLLYCTRWFKAFESVNEIVKCGHSNESY